MATAFEQLFEKIAEITEIINLATAEGKKKSEIISLIRERFSEFKDIGDSSFNAYIPIFPFVFNELNSVKQANLALQAETDSVKQELNITLNNLDSAIQDRDNAISELNSIKQEIKHREDKDMQTLNNQLNSELDTGEIAIFIQQTEQKFVELNNRIKQLESDRQELKQIKQEIKHKGLNNVGKWNIVESGGYYRAFRNIEGKNVGVYIGKDCNDELAKEKIQAKGYPID